MVDNSVKAVVVIALGGALAAGWLSNNPEQGKALLAMMRGADPAPAAAAPVHASQPLFPSAPPRQQATRAAPIVSAGYGREELKADQGGQFQSDVEIEGSRIHMLVDTGATMKVVRELLPKAHVATVYAKPLGRPMVDTFITEVSQDTWIYFPWDMGLAFQPPIAKDGA